MNENTKTLTFLGAAIVVLVVAVIARPKPPAAVAPEMQGKTLFESFNPLDSTRLEILEVGDTGDAKRFEVAQINGRWQIPSHQGYPTDAKDQLSQAAGNLTNLTALQVVSDAIGDHAEYGVLDPQGAKSAAGVGKRVMLRGKDDKPLVQLIIGKEVPDRPGLHYVRRVGEDQVYIVDVKTEKLSTKFEDWIEKDLLKISSWDMKAVKVRDYALTVAGGRALYDQRAEIALNYNDNDPKWTLGDYRVFNKTKRDYEPAKLADDQELNASKLDTMKSALDDLKIVDVQRKPAGLSANLKATGDLANADNKAAMSLMDKGFYPVQTGENSFEVLSTKGDVRVLMKDGVQYVLRFGEIAGADEAQKKDAKKDDKKTTDKKDDTSGGVTRYLLVMTEFNPDALEKPKLDPLPEEKKDEKKADDKKPEEKKPEEKKPADKKPEEKKADKEADQKAKDQKAAELKAERERVEKENKRKQDEYNDKVKKGEERVKELNGRFADWYYVISEDVYKRIHLTREDIVKKKEKKEDKKDEKKDDPLGKNLMQPLPGDKDDHAGHDHAKEEKKDAADKPAEKKDAPAEKKDVPAAKKDAAEKKDAPAPKKATPPEKTEKKAP